MEDIKAKIERLEKIEKQLEARKEKDKARHQRYMKKQKGQGKKQIACILSPEAYDNLLNLKNLLSLPVNQVIEKALSYYINSVILNVDKNVVNNEIKKSTITPPHLYPNRQDDLLFDQPLELESPPPDPVPDPEWLKQKEQEEKFCSDLDFNFTFLPIDLEPLSPEPAELEIAENIFKRAQKSIPSEKTADYTAWVKGIIKQLVQLGTMTNREIKEALEKHNIKTAKGLDKWAVGTIGNIAAAVRKEKPNA